MIFQDPMTAFDPVFTIGHQIAETIMSHRKVSKREALAEAEQLLLRVEIKESRLDPDRFSSDRQIHRERRFANATLLSCKSDNMHVCTPSIIQI